MLQHDNRILVHRQVVVVDARRHVVVVGEHHRLARMLVKLCFGRRRLDHRAVGGKVTAQHRQAVGLDQGAVDGTDDVVVEHFRIGDVLTQGFSVDGFGIRLQ